MGPGDGIQIQRLIDLTTTIETAGPAPGPTNSQLTSPYLPQGPPPPIHRVKINYYRDCVRILY